MFAEGREGQLEAALWLVAHGDAFTHADNGPFFVSTDLNADGQVLLSLNMNDTFGYACADSEEFTLEDAPMLARIAREHGWFGLVDWVSRKRGYDPDVKDIKEKLDTWRSEHEVAQR